MNIYENLKKRDLIAQVTNEEKVENILNNDKVKFYIGFEPTADSLHVGHFVQIMIMSRLQKAGHFPILLFGGGTGLIGDPSGKTDMRKMLSPEQINHNIECFKVQAERFLDLSPQKALVVNNASWLSQLNYIDFLREIGVHFSVNRMLAAECYKQRLEKGLTFFELNYMIMQSYDFLVLNKKYNCQLQLGGDDQWSNILGGVDLIRRVQKQEAYGLTFKLLTTSEGKKMGKTEKGAVWLDASKTSPYDFYQYWRNVDDKDISKCLNMLTFLSVEEISELSNLKDEKINHAKEILAYEITKLVHGEEEAKKAQNTAKNLFAGAKDSSSMPQYILPKDTLIDEKLPLTSLLTLASLASSKSDARRLIEQGGISVDEVKITNPSTEITKHQLETGIIIKKGKKVFKRINLEN